MPPFADNVVVIANQRARWCGNLLLKMGIPTPVCELARNDIILNLMTLRSQTGYFFVSSFQKPLLNKNRWAISRKQLQVIKQSATLNTGNFINSVWIISTT